jgi:long-chain acyl-CoA synthetase
MRYSALSPLPTRVFDLIAFQLQSFPKSDCLAGKVNGAWRKFSTDEVSRIVDELAWGLHSVGIRRGDRVGNSTETNRPEWNFVDLAVMSLGAIHVPIYPNLAPEEFTFILKDCGAKAIFVSSAGLLKLVQTIALELPELPMVYTYEELPGATSWQALQRQGQALLNDSSRAELAAIRSTVQPEEMATLIYTSGTTGTPKGVMLSHSNLMSNCLVCSDIVGSGPNERALSFLPLCHIFERTVVNIYLRSGTSIYYAENLNTIGENLREIRPQIFTTVPRLLEKIYERIVDRGELLTGVQRHLFRWALRLAMDYEPEHVSWFGQLKLAIADRLVFSHWRRALGGRIRAIISGSAALRPRLARVFWAARMPVYEGYGPTEASPVISVNRLNENHIGTVGRVIEGGEVKIAADGEILYRGPNVMMGYYKRPDLTAETVDAEGWLHTGDIGEFAGQFLKITDRKKEIFKTSGGKYIAPQQIENKLKESSFVSQAMIVGENHKFPAALIVPSLERVNEFFKSRGIVFNSRDQLVENGDVRALFETEVQRINAGLSRYAQVKKFALLADEWTIERGELTPTLKLKRKRLLKEYDQQICDLYTGEERAVEVLQTRTKMGPLKESVSAE